MRLALLPVVAALAAPAALAQDYPTLKPGQWEMTMTSSRSAKDAPPVKTTMCTDDALQKEMTAMGTGMSRELCAKYETRRDGARWLGHSECTIGGSKMVARNVMTLTGDTAYRMEVEATYDPPLAGMKESRSVLVGRWTGACRDGLVPGDFIGPTGQKFNIKGIGAAKAPKPSSPPASKPKAPQ